ncbi:Cytosolic phospholipase A2 gamma [Varanus komodoensis]|nr:Cytosolic phospholipase A2 gamma [Varanus komodoensis]
MSVVPAGETSSTILGRELKAAVAHHWVDSLLLLPHSEFESGEVSGKEYNNEHLFDWKGLTHTRLIPEDFIGKVLLVQFSVVHLFHSTLNELLKKILAKEFGSAIVLIKTAQISDIRTVKTEVNVLKTLSKHEQSATASRKEEVKRGLAKLGIQCDADKVPNIAVLGSGGGLRAMIALYGTLVELKKCNLLDCVMYLLGVSGSTWCMSSIYKTEDWANKIEILEKNQSEKLVQGQWNLIKAKKAVLEAAREENYSLTDFWSYFIVYKMLKEELNVLKHLEAWEKGTDEQVDHHVGYELDESKLSDQKRACENGKNPYPLYAAVDKHTYSGHQEGSWFEFNPFGAGAPGTAGEPGTTAYVDIKQFGSIFDHGQLSEERKERNVCYLQGLWGSALASEQEIKKAVIGALLDLLKQDREEYFSSSSSSPQDLVYRNLNMLSLIYQYILELQLCALDVTAAKAEGFFDLLENLLKVLEPVEKYLVTPPYSPFQPIKGKYQNINTKDSGVEVPELKTKQIVSLIDAGLAINTAYPLALHPDRKVKLILSFDFSAGDPFETVKKAAEYCKIRGIKFPRINERELQDKDNPSNCYIFRADDLTVMHFPLFNIVNCQDKIAEYHQTFSTFKLHYSDEEIEKLLTAAKNNVITVQQKILEEIKHIVGTQSQQA